MENVVKLGRPGEKDGAKENCTKLVEGVSQETERQGPVSSEHDSVIEEDITIADLCALMK